MWGGKESSSTTKEVICQMCEHEGHSASECKWVYSTCHVLTCNGLMKLLTSKEIKTYGKKFLKCQYEKCAGLKWLEEDSGQSSSSSSQTNNNQSNNACFLCGLHDHWMSNCPWKKNACPAGCMGVREVRTSWQTHSYGKKFLKCVQCGNFQWLSDARPNSSRENLRVKVEVSLDDFCKEFSNKFKYEGWM